MKPALAGGGGHLAKVVPIAGGSPPRPVRRHTVLFALLAAALVATLGITINLARRAPSRPPPLLVVAPVTRGLVVGNVQARGILEPLRMTTIAQPLSGRLIEVRARAGDQVKRGQLLARFDSLAQRANLARAEARLVGAEVASFEAEVQLHRLEERLAEGYFPRLQRAPAEAADDPADAEPVDSDSLREVAAARLARAAADVAAGEAAYKLARRRLTDGEVRAPGDGTLLARFVEEGQVLPAGTPLFKLAGDGGHLQVAASVAEADAGALAVGHPVTFTVPAFAGRSFSGTITRLLPLDATEAGRRQPLVIGIASDQDGLRPGMSVTAQIRTASAGVIARVPNAALLFAPGAMTTSRESPAVWLVDEGTQQLRQVPVEVRLQDGGFAEVRGADLREGAAVALGYARTP